MKLTLLREAIRAELGRDIDPASTIEMRIQQAEHDITEAIDILEAAADQVEGYTEVMDRVDGFLDTFYPS